MKILYITLFFFTFPFPVIVYTPGLRVNRYFARVEYLFLLFFFFDCEFNLQGPGSAETGNCGILPNRIADPTNRTGDDSV